MLHDDLVTYFPGKPINLPVVPVLYKRTANDELILAIQNAYKTSLDSVSPIGIRKVVVGLSGGVDSVVACAVLKHGGINTYAIIIEMDDDEDFSEETIFAISIAKKINIDYEIVNATHIYREHLNLLDHTSQLTRIHLRSRLINNIIFQFADHHSAVVVDTTDKSEDILKIYEESFRGHIASNISLYKSEPYDVAEYLGFPELKKKNSGCPDLLDIDAFGVSWDRLDPILHLIIDKGMSINDISNLYGVDRPWLQKINDRILLQPLRTTIRKIMLGNS
ncbi:MAG: hypothetical protein A2X09_16445 [Bacteroidetes bacterium GWF2_43_11]|nr:MAG: hypothetical protein A2X09_16445 [Bacteroidetes bacterium GWF2_43_11]